MQSEREQATAGARHAVASAEVPVPATLAAMLARVVATLRSAGIGEPAAEARELVMVAAGVSGIDVLTKGERLLEASQVARIEDFARRRAAHEPISRIAGEREFYGRVFSLSAGTLDPRADTETLVSAALEIVREQGWQNQALRLLDVGIGSGAILVTLLAELPQARGLGIDISADALATARQNAARHGVAGRLELAQRDLHEGIEGAFDMIVANPPYIPTADIAGLEPEVRCHDPRAALDGGHDGLDFYRLLAHARGQLEPSGWLLVEVGAGQANEVAQILTSQEQRARVRSFVDIGGHLRTVAVQPHPVGTRE